MNVEEFKLCSESERIIIRPLIIADYQNWLNEFKSRFPSKSRYDKGRRDMSECTEEWFELLISKHQSFALNDIAHIFGIFRKNDGKHLGMIDFSTLDRDFQWARVGYTIHNQHWQKGYGKEAVKEAINIAFRDLKFHRIEAHIDANNIPSIKLAKSIGMKFECVREKFIFQNGEWADQTVYYINSN